MYTIYQVYARYIIYLFIKRDKENQKVVHFNFDDQTKRFEKLKIEIQVFQ